MKKSLSIALVSTALVGGLAVGASAIPAMAATSTPTPSTSGSTTTGSGTTSTDRTADITARITSDLAGLVADGTLTQAQADKVASTLAATMPAGGGGHRGGGHGGFGGLTAAATAIGVTEAELRTQLEAGKSVADVAAAEGVSEQKVIDAIVTAAKEHVAAEVASGEHTQAEADARLADLEARVKTMVETKGLPQRGGPAPTTDGSAAATPSSSSTA